MEKNSKPLVSIILPVYNVERYLPKCLDSLVNQTLKNIEIIIVNDGSPDNSNIIIDEYQKKHSKLIKVLNQKNQGLSDARNNGLKLATADYVVFIDSDDYVDYNMIEKLYNKIIDDNADVIICGNRVVDEKGNIISCTYPNNFNYSNLTERTIFGNMCAWNKIYKKSLICDNKLKFRSKVWYEDIDFSYKILTLSKKTSFLEDNLYNYLLREDSIMNSQKANRNLELILAFDEMINYSKNKHIYKKYYNAIEYLCIYHIYITGITRIINIKTDKKTKKSIIMKFSNYLKLNFPNYRKNIYLKKLSRNKKIVYFFIEIKQFWIINLIFKIKKGV